WQEFGHSLRLSASCGHQAVMVALQEQAAYLDGLLHHASTQVRTGGSEDDTWLAALPTVLRGTTSSRRGTRSPGR
ncbi:hypothetical protein GA0115255_103591, partial [Streptomyces sp. Ncost-T6T-2b]